MVSVEHLVVGRLGTGCLAAFVVIAVVVVVVTLVAVVVTLVGTLVGTLAILFRSILRWRFFDFLTPVGATR